MLSLIKSHIDPLSLREKALNAIAACLVIMTMGLVLHLLPHDNQHLPLLASMGASVFLLFVVPHSPMTQPGPVITGQLVSALAGLACAHLIDDPVIAGACSVGAAILGMELLRSLHPPGAATALAVGMSGTQLHGAVWPFLGYAVLGNILILLALAYLINNLLLGRRYPIGKSHHPHHEAFDKHETGDLLQLTDPDIEWALGHMDGIVDVSKEDLIDIYELAIEHALARRKSAPKDA
ncbi:MAG: HPP family protein [Gammaproteobacteria bacterium]|nr:HPP family protein [Gammaproteobacteria bacterium]